MMNPDEFLWVEKYRPKTIKDTLLTEEMRQTFEGFLAKKNLPNFLFHGPQGVGKTTVARALLEEMGADYIVINGSKDGNIDTLRTRIYDFASTVSFNGGRKYVILDEADYLNANSTQPALRNFMEEFSANCGFILTCNYRNKIIKELHSRCSLVDFRIPKTDRPKIAGALYARLCTILKAEKISYDDDALAAVVKKYFPDMRRCLNELQTYSVTGKIDAGILTRMEEISVAKLIEAMRAKDIGLIRKWTAENSDMDSATFYRMLYDNSVQYFKGPGIASLIIILAKYQYQEAFVADREINTAAMCIEIAMECEFK